MINFIKLAVLTVFWGDNVNDYFIRYISGANDILKNNSRRLNFKFYLLDNSPKPTLKTFIYRNRVHINKNITILEKNIDGFGKANNFLNKISKKNFNPDYILLLNPDTEFYYKNLSRLINTIRSSPDIFCVEAKQFPFEHTKNFDKTTLETSWCSGCCLLVNTHHFDKLNGFDETFKMYVEDVDLCWRAKILGLKCLYQPKSTCIHHTYGYNKNNFIRQFYSVRNNMIMRYRFGGLKTLIRGIYISFVASFLAFKNQKFKECLNILHALVSGVISSFFKVSRSSQSKKYDFIFVGFDYRMKL